MTITITALVSDAKWLVDQRDVLKSAGDAAGIAATLELSRQLDRDPNISDADLEAILEPIARRYILINLMHLDADRYERAEQSLDVEVAPDRAQRTVDVAAEADLGGIYLSQIIPFMKTFAESSGIGERTRSESLVETLTNPIEVVLAIDISDSMKKAVDADRIPRKAWNDDYTEWHWDAPTRMAVVKEAAATLVAVLATDDESRIAFGVVPWASVVRLDEQTRNRWELNDWARYPTRVVYGAPYRCSPGGECQDPPPVTQDVAPTPPEPWLGCLNEHRTGSIGTLATLPTDDELLSPPAWSAFAQGYFMSLHAFAYECVATLPADMAFQSCYGPPTLTPQLTFGDKQSQYPCVNRVGYDSPPPIQPLSTDRAVVEQAIEALDAVGLGTYSTLGVLWAQRLLEHSWKDVWEGTDHPADPEDPDNAGLRKAIVLLTDGNDNYCSQFDPACDNRDVGIPPLVACDAAKAAGSEIFVVTAMAPSFVPQDLADRLRACSSESDNPDGTYVFVDNPTPEALRASFAEIAAQLVRVRRVY